MHLEKAAQIAGILALLIGVYEAVHSTDPGTIININGPIVIFPSSPESSDPPEPPGEPPDEPSDEPDHSKDGHTCERYC
jgi:hypothetical protein